MAVFTLNVFSALAFSACKCERGYMYQTHDHISSFAIFVSIMLGEMSFCSSFREVVHDEGLRGVVALCHAHPLCRQLERWWQKPVRVSPTPTRRVRQVERNFFHVQLLPPKGYSTNCARMIHADRYHARVATKYGRQPGLAEPGVVTRAKAFALKGVSLFFLEMHSSPQNRTSWRTARCTLRIRLAGRGGSA